MSDILDNRTLSLLTHLSVYRTINAENLREFFDDLTDNEIGIFVTSLVSAGYIMLNSVEHSLHNLNFYIDGKHMYFSDINITALGLRAKEAHFFEIETQSLLPKQAVRIARRANTIAITFGVITAIFAISAIIISIIAMLKVN